MTFTKDNHAVGYTEEEAMKEEEGTCILYESSRLRKKRLEAISELN